LGTETQKALHERLQAERRRALDAERESIRREAEQRIARVRAENALLRERLGDTAPSALGLRMELRAALQAELEQERQEARSAVQEQLAQTIAERDQLAAALRQAETVHHTELEALRGSLRKAAELLQEQYDQGFVSGLKQAAQAFASDPQDSAQVEGAAPAPVSSEIRLGLAHTGVCDEQPGFESWAQNPAPRARSPLSQQTRATDTEDEACAAPLTSMQGEHGDSGPPTILAGLNVRGRCAAVADCEAAPASAPAHAGVNAMEQAREPRASLPAVDEQTTATSNVQEDYGQ